MDVNDLLDYYKIAKDSKAIKRVEEVASGFDKAIKDGDTSKVSIITSELTNMGNGNLPILPKAKPFSEILNDGMKKQNDQFKNFVKNVGLGNLNDINIDYDIDK